jgi:hypothetical protein
MDKMIEGIWPEWKAHFCAFSSSRRGGGEEVKLFILKWLCIFLLHHFEGLTAKTMPKTTPAI